ncbi:MAG: sensor domain-containing diguanylate cyclase [Desulfarculus sp.]|nr:sensor domain-containing diguanylate cyclase [Pseudomonadota bacterium]MBV1715544.1 sensor domain-containing diguanylate cyclase [Desulfarculus sp.]MBU4575381.1 sensor domain-containing diguanylate cyclase [Pseudomonadota bacterium]MBU4599458.1 sensor domain-containing diguanylate cyclase [Pseudomonadota bacterium]MBV1740285.1 sensor domain-containing diguanylate cyclase [Desulfarculus sp.]
MADQSFIDRLVQLCPDGIIGVNREGTIVIFNEAAERLFKRDDDEVLGKLHITDIYRPPDVARQIKKLLYDQEHGGKGRLDEVEVEVINAEGQNVPIRLSAALLVENGQEIGSVGFFHDMTARKELEEELLRRSITDSLTGLYNRRHFHETLSHEVQRSQRYRRPLTLAMLDLDSFKPFNDTYGHHEGDNILRLVSDTMRASLRQLDHAFRLGGDEFAFVLVETDLDQGLMAVERFRSAFNQAWPTKMGYLGGKLPPVTVSIGLAQLGDGEKPDKLTMRADLAMYEAKKGGGNRAVKARPEIKQD